MKKRKIVLAALILSCVLTGCTEKEEHKGVLVWKNMEKNVKIERKIWTNVTKNDRISVEVLQGQKYIQK